MFISGEVPMSDEQEYDNEGLNADDNVEWGKLVEILEKVPEERLGSTKNQRLFYCFLKNKLKLKILWIFPRKKSESPEMRFLLHFQKAKKMAI